MAVVLVASLSRTKTRRITMKKNIKQMILTGGLVWLMMALAAIWTMIALPGCAMLDNLTDQPQLQTYTFIYDGGEYSALLPKEVPLPPKDAATQPDWFPGWGLLYVMHVAYEEPGLPPTVSFWFTQELGVVAVVYHVMVDGKIEHLSYIYLKGLPVKMGREEINKLLKGWSRGLK